MKAIYFILALSLLLAGCASSAETWSAPEDFQAISLIPPLEIPAGAQMLGGGGGGGPGVEQRAADFSSALELDEIHGFIAAQLLETGWRETDQQSAATQRVTYWELVEENGTTWAAKLEATRLSDSSPYEYAIRVQLLQPR